MNLDFLAEIAKVWPSQHHWLSAEFIAESQKQAWDVTTRKQHYVPHSYLKRWALDGLVQPFQVDAHNAFDPQPPRDVGKAKNLYTLPETGSTMDLPLRWVEKLLSRVEDACSHHIDEMVAIDAGVISNKALVEDMSVFLGLQITRTLGQRERHLAIINGPKAAKREYLKRTRPEASAAEIERQIRPRFTDPKQEALHLMIEDVRYPVAPLLKRRRWAVYRTTRPIATCDDPVILLPGPPFQRPTTLAGSSAVALYPLDPLHILVMLRWDLRHTGPFILDVEETENINLEIIAAATRTTFERPNDDIAVRYRVPTRVVLPELDDAGARALEDEAALAYLFGTARRISRWGESTHGPPWPVTRWYSS